MQVHERLTGLMTFLHLAKNRLTQTLDSGLMARVGEHSVSSEQDNFARNRMLNSLQLVEGHIPRKRGSFQIRLVLRGLRPALTCLGEDAVNTVEGHLNKIH